MGAILCIIGDTLYQKWQDNPLESHNNNQEWEENVLECERVDKEFEEYINTFYNQAKFDHRAYEEKEEARYPYINLKKKGGKIYLKSQLCGESHPTSVCAHLANYENSDNEIDNHEVHSEDSISNGRHAEFSIYDILAE